MTLNLSESLAFNEGVWKKEIADPEAVAALLAAAAGDLEARVSALESVGAGLQAPIPNPVTARKIGPDVISDTGWQDMGGVAHAFHAEAANSGDTGAYNLGAELYVGCDKPDDTRTCGLRYIGFGNSRYPRCEYWTGSAWAAFQYNRGDVNFGRELTLADKLDMAFEQDNKVFNVRLNGVQITSPGGTPTVAASFIALAFPDGPGKYARYVRTGGSTPSAWSTTLSGGTIVPIALRGAEFDGNTFPVFTFDYTGSPLGYVGATFDTLGNRLTAWKPAIKVENSVAGKAKYRLADTGLQPNQNYVFKIAEADGDGLPKAAATLSQTLLMPGPMQFSTNVTIDWDWYANSNMANRLAINWQELPNGGNGLRGHWQANPQMGKDGLPTAAAMTALIAANGSGPSAFIKPPRVSGQLGRVIWKGNPGDIDFVTANANYTIVARSSNGTYSWIDYRHTFKLADLVKARNYNAFYCRIYVKAGTPSGMKCYDIDGSGNPLSTTQWDRDYIEDCRLFAGHGTDILRTMDISGVISQAAQVVDITDWAEKGEYLPYFGKSIPDILDLFEQAGVGGRIHIPLQATEAYVRKLGQTLKPFLLRTKLPCSAALANELWNSGQPNYHRAVALYRADTTTAWPGGTPDEFNCMQRWWSRQHYRVMTWLAEELGEALPYLTRVLEVQNDTGYNQTSVRDYWPGTKATIDQVDVAPYCGNKAGADITGSDATAIAALAAKLRTIYPGVHANAKINRDIAYAAGHKFGTYEGGYEDFGNGELQVAFRNDPVGRDVTAELLDHWASNVGVTYRWYCDNGHPIYGHRQFAGQSFYNVIDGAPPAYVGQAFMSKMAATAKVN